MVIAQIQAYRLQLASPCLFVEANARNGNKTEAFYSKENQAVLTVNRFLDLEAYAVAETKRSSSSTEVFGPWMRNCESDRRDMLGTAIWPGASSTRSRDNGEYV